MLNAGSGCSCVILWYLCWGYSTRSELLITEERERKWWSVDEINYTTVVPLGRRAANLPSRFPCGAGLTGCSGSKQTATVLAGNVETSNKLSSKLHFLRQRWKSCLLIGVLRKTLCEASHFGRPYILKKHTKKDCGNLMLVDSWILLLTRFIAHWFRARCFSLYTGIVGGGQKKFKLLKGLM